MSNGEKSDDEIVQLIDRINNRSKNHYEVLGVEKGPPQNDDDELLEKKLKKAYRKIALKIHPDKCDLPGAEDAFKKVSNAYATLTNPTSRKNYDLFGTDDNGGAAGTSSSSPFSSTGGGAHVDPSEFFREFMSQNPDFAAAFAAGQQRNTSGGATTNNNTNGFGGGGGFPAAGGGIHVNGINLQNFNFSAATVGGFKSWWERQEQETLPDWKFVKVPFRWIGILLFDVILKAFVNCMPYSGYVAGFFGVFVGSHVAYWFLSRSVWFLAFSAVPYQLRKPAFLFQRKYYTYLLLQLTILIVGEHYFELEFDFQGGCVFYMLMNGLNTLLRDNGIGVSSGGGQQSNGPSSSFSSYTFTTGSLGSNGFVFSNMNNSGNIGGGGAASSSSRIRHNN